MSDHDERLISQQAALDAIYAVPRKNYRQDRYFNEIYKAIDTLSPACPDMSRQVPMKEGCKRDEGRVEESGRSESLVPRDKGEIRAGIQAMIETLDEKHVRCKKDGSYQQAHHARMMFTSYKDFANLLRYILGEENEWSKLFAPQPTEKPEGK